MLLHKLVFSNRGTAMPDYITQDFEYGCGKSTEFVYKYTKASIHAVDTSIDWVNRLKRLAVGEDSE